METHIQQSIIYVLSGLLIVICGFYAYVKYKHSYWSRRGVKTPPTHPIFGNFKDTFLLKKSPAQTLKEIYDSADPDDPYIGFYIFHKPILLLRDAQLIKQIMVKDFTVFPNRRFGSTTEKDSVGLVNLLGIKQPRWKYLRSKITPALTGQKLRSMIPLMVDRWNPMLHFIEETKEQADGWKYFELKDLSSRYTTDIISSLAFGITTNSFDENDTAFWEAGQGVLSGLKRGMILIILFYVPELARLVLPFATGPSKFFREVFWHSMNTREKVGNKRGDLIDSLLALKNGEQLPAFKFEGDNLLAQAVAFYIAGFEASSTAIAFALFELARNPEIQEEIYKEIEDAIKNKEMTMEAINSMQLLDGVVDETLRLYPPLPMTDRIALTDYQIPDTKLILEEGMSVYMSITGTNHDSKNFPNPEKFYPLRRKEENGGVQDSFAFGVGPRSCVGQRMGQLITKIAIIAVVMNYEISYKMDKGNIYNPVTVFTNAADGLNVRFKKRKEKCQ